MKQPFKEVSKELLNKRNEEITDSYVYQLIETLETISIQAKIEIARWKIHGKGTNQNIDGAISLLNEIQEKEDREMEDVLFLRDCCCPINNHRYWFSMFNRKHQSQDAQTNRKLLS